MLLAHHIVISGFQQHRGRLSGCDRVVARLNRFRRPGVRVELKRWNDDWRSEAAFIARHAAPPLEEGRRKREGGKGKSLLCPQSSALDPRDPSPPPPRVCIYAYSWGFGWGAARLAYALAELETPIPVYGLIGCDGVYRHGYRFGNWRALWPWSTIHLPYTVDRARTVLFHQDNTLPRGHDVKIGGAEVPRTKIESVVVNGDVRLNDPATHTNIDESLVWQKACEELAESCDRQIQYDERF